MSFNAADHDGAGFRHVSKLLATQLAAIQAAGVNSSRNAGSVSSLLNLFANAIGDQCRRISEISPLASGWAEDRCVAVGLEIDRGFADWSIRGQCCSRGLHSFRAIVLSALASYVTTGNAYLLVDWRASEKWSTRLRLLESGAIRGRQDGGVIEDKHGVPIRYRYVSAGGAETEIPRFYPNGTPRLIHWYDLSSVVDGSRGVPIIAAVLDDIRRHSEYMSRELQAMIASTLLLIVAKVTGGGNLEEWMGETTVADLASTARSLHVDGPSVLPVPPGIDIDMHAPTRPASSSEPFLAHIEAQIAAGSGVTAEAFSGRWADTTYTSSRMSWARTSATLDRHLEGLTEMLLTPVSDAFLREAIAKGRVAASLEEFEAAPAAIGAATWLFAREGYLNEKQEAEAADLRLYTGLSTYPWEMARQGLHWREVIETRARVNALLAASGLPVIHSPDSTLEPLEAPSDGDD